METEWIRPLFGTNKPIIAMCHFLGLPGDPGYDKKGGIRRVVDRARKDLLALQSGGVDSIMFSNEFSLPYLLDVENVTVATMARIIAELKPELKVPFGVNVLWDPIKSIDLAVAVGASFVREIFSGVYASDFGVWNTNFGKTVRHKHHIGGEDIKLLFNIVPEAAVYIGGRDISSIAKSTVFNHLPDALCVSGLTAGVPLDSSILQKVKDSVPETYVFANTGTNKENIMQLLSVADGAVVGTTFKKDGIFENQVDEDRVKEFMDIVIRMRK
ncbi:MAG: BtpA/SgcQ family protein [Anaerolineaceae bacterium]|nr:BtpA/SgcQ family protein [Anaerolineaceae bacterium]